MLNIISTLTWEIRDANTWDTLADTGYMVG